MSVSMLGSGFTAQQYAHNQLCVVFALLTVCTRVCVCVCACECVCVRASVWLCLCVLKRETASRIYFLAHCLWGLVVKWSTVCVVDWLVA